MIPPGEEAGLRYQSIKASSASETVFTPTSSHPAGPAALPSGTTQRVNPICAASRTRSAACVDAPDFSRQPDLAEDRGGRLDRPVADARRHGAENREIRGRLVDGHAAGHVHEHVLGNEVQAGALLEDCEQQRQAVLIETARHAARISVGARADERLHLDEERPRTFDAAEHGRSRGVAGALARETAATGSGTAFRPVPVISNTPSSLTAPNRFFTARTTRCAWCFSPSK